jgi:adenosine 3'-phospho 5'-phosphosulfate transporter B2
MATDTDKASTFRADAIALAGAFIGLQVSYLSWGLMQEYIMTKEYETGKFPSAVFIVFTNRILAFALALLIVVSKGSKGAPLWAYGPSSISNAISSWAQYTALNYVSFPTQTLFKSTKIIPVMLVGKYVNNAKFTTRKYIDAVVITMGVAMFMLFNKSGKKGKESVEDASQVHPYPSQYIRLRA